MMGRSWLIVLIAILPLMTGGCRRGTRNPTNATERGVPLLVLQSSDGATLAFAPVYINGEGPFAFALDTGASHSAVDEDLARQLGLPVTGPRVEVTGVAASADSQPVEVAKWRVGNIEMQDWQMVTLQLAEPNRRLKMRGLLGSDVLSTFGAVRVDYNRQQLILGSSP